MAGMDVGGDWRAHIAQVYDSRRANGVEFGVHTC